MKGIVDRAAAKLEAAGSGGSSGSGSGGVGEVEVKFEWARGKSKGKRKTKEKEGGRGRRGTGATSATVILPAEGGAERGGSPADEREREGRRRSLVGKKERGASAGHARRSLESLRSASPTGAPSITTNTTSASDPDHPADATSDRGHDDEEEEEESDAEDSETPWTCTLVVRAPPLPPLPPHRHGSGYSADSGANTVRVKVAAVVPTPHHPKVVALLKIPFPLPDIEIALGGPRTGSGGNDGGLAVPGVEVRKRVVSAAGVARPAPHNPLSEPPASGSGSGNGGSKFWSGKQSLGQGGQGGAGAKILTLTAEEIKDVVSCTGLWLVVREAFGGVGKVSRKGDGWRIRG